MYYQKELKNNKSDIKLGKSIDCGFDWVTFPDLDKTQQVV